MLKRLLLAFIAIGFSACTGLPLNAVAPKVSMTDVDIKSLGLFEQHFEVGLRVSNPNDFDLRIEALEFELELNGHPFATGLAQTVTLVPAAATVEMQVDATTQSKNLIHQLKKLLPEALKDGVPYRIVGRVKTDRSSRWIPFDHAGSYGGVEKKPKGRTI